MGPPGASELLPPLLNQVPQRDRFRCYKGPSRSKAGAAWILAAAIHLRGQGDEALHSFSTTLPPGLGNTNKAGSPASRAQLGPQLSQSCPLGVLTCACTCACTWEGGRGGWPAVWSEGP